MLRYSALLFLPLVAFISCRKDPKIPDPTYLVFGDYAGECAGDCAHLYKLQGGVLYEETSITYLNTQDFANGTYEKMPYTEYEKVKDLQNAIPEQLYTESKKAIGQPDAGDWGGYYVETVVNGERRYWLVDTQEDNLPEYIKPFQQKLGEAIRKLR